ncbi:MAG: dTMP kinase [Pseudomonadota bacterium]
MSVPKDQPRGRFITVEGIEGVGKSTHIRRLKSHVEAAGYSVDVTREPGGTPTAEAIRALLISHGDEPMPEAAELLLMFAARALHVANRIRPALNDGVWVISDRFVDASRAYQGGGRGLSSARIEQLAELALDGLEPDVTLLLDAPPAVGLGRAERRGSKDRFETETLDFFERVRQSYLDLAKAEPSRFVVLDASGTIEGVAELVDEAAQKILDRFN